MFFGMLSVVQGFSYWWGWGRRVGIPPTNWKIAHPLTWKTPPPHLYFHFILFVHTGYANFYFNGCSIFTECCFYLWKRFEWSNSLIIRFTPHDKKSPHSTKFLIPPPHPLLLCGQPCHLGATLFFLLIQNSDLLRDEKNVKTMFEIKRYLVKMFV